MASNERDFLNDWNEIKNLMLKNEKWHHLFKDYTDITYDEAKQLNSDDYNHAAHVFIWSKRDDKLWNFNLNATILMQLRFDGFIGFPGKLYFCSFFFILIY